MATHCFYVRTNLGTCLTLLVPRDGTVFHFKDKLRKEHKQCFPHVGDITISAFKVKFGGRFYRFSDSMIVSKPFDHTSGDWYVYVDIHALRADKNELRDPEDQNIELDSQTGVADSTTCLDGKRSPKESFHQSATAPRYGVDESESHELCGKGQLEVVTSQKGDNQQTSDADRVILTVNSNLVDEHTKGQPLKEAMRNSEGSDESHNSCVQVPTQELYDLRGATKQVIGLEKEANGVELVEIDQVKNLAPTLEPVDVRVTSRDDDVNESRVVCGQVQVGVASEQYVTLPREKLHDLLSGAIIDNDNERSTRSSLASSGELVAYAKNQLEAISGPATKKKRKRNKRSKKSSHFKGIAKDINGGPGNVDHVEGRQKAADEKKKKKKRKRNRKQKKSSQYHVKNILNEINEVPLTVNHMEVRQKEIEMVEGIDGDMGSEKPVPSYAGNHSSKILESQVCSMKPKETNSRVQAARSETKVKHSDASVKNKNWAMNFFKNAENSNSSEDESYTTAHVSTKTPSSSSSDDESDGTPMFRKQGNNLGGGTNRFLGMTLQDILRNSISYKKALQAASQSQTDDESPASERLPDFQAALKFCRF